MLLTESPWTATTATANAPPAYELRLHGGTEHEQSIPIPPGKHSIGSGPRCSLRLQFPGVQPLHCLVVHDGQSLHVRRWAEDALVNGLPFDEAGLAVGDVLSLGPVDLEIVVPGWEDPVADPLGEVMTKPAVAEAAAELVGEAASGESDHFHTTLLDPVDRVIDAISALEEPTVLGEPVATPDAHETAESPETDESTKATITTEAAERVFSELRAAKSVARRRSRRLLATLRSQRDEYSQLADRVNALENKVEQSLAEHRLAAALTESSANAAVPEVDDRPELDVEDSARDAELVEVRDQLAVRESELAHARYSIDVLERQLIDSQHTMNALADERALWETQLTEFEARLTEYVGRIQELEHLLDQVRASQKQESLTPTLNATEWVEEADANEPIADDVVDAEIVSTVEELPSEATLSENSYSEEIVPAGESASLAEAVVVNDAVEPVEAFAPAEPAPAEEVDAALEHLRDLAIWRQDANEATAGGAAATKSPDFVPEAKPQSAPQPASFIDRYSHLIEADAANEPMAAPPAAPLQSTVTAKLAAADHGNEESIEQYMAKLMERMRGSSTGSATVEQPVAEEIEAHAAPKSTVHEPPPPIEPLKNLEEFRPKAIAPEFSGDLAAMRALANQSTRHAIGIHTARTLRGHAKTRCIVSLLGAAAGFYLLLLAPSWKSLQFAAGCAAAIVALYWGRLTLVSLIKGIQFGAFQDFDEETDPAETLHPPLPIDVERRSESQG